MTYGLGFLLSRLPDVLFPIDRVSKVTDVREAVRQDLAIPKLILKVAHGDWREFHD